MKGISIVFNLYQPDKKVLGRIFDSFKIQEVNIPAELVIVDKKTDDADKSRINDFAKKARNMRTRTIKVDSRLSFAESMNVGLKNSRYENVVVIQQDCIPPSNKWLRNLIEPLNQNNVVATTSKVIYPDELWNSMSLFTKSIMLNEKGTITPGLDEKACGYKKDVFGSIGFFNEKEFRTAGEDYDLYIKLKKIGKIVYPDASVFHLHPTTFSQRLRKSYQYANGYGALTRIHRTNMILWYVGIIKALPVIGLITYPLSYPWKKGGLAIFPAYLASSFIDHFYYIPGFWKGFIEGKQTVR